MVRWEIDIRLLQKIVTDKRNIGRIIFFGDRIVNIIVAEYIQISVFKTWSAVVTTLIHGSDGFRIVDICQIISLDTGTAAAVQRLAVRINLRVLHVAKDKKLLVTQVKFGCLKILIQRNTGNNLHLIRPDIYNGNFLWVCFQCIKIISIRFYNVCFTDTLCADVGIGKWSIHSTCRGCCRIRRGAGAIGTCTIVGCFSWIHDNSAVGWTGNRWRIQLILIRLQVCVDFIIIGCRF